MRYKIGGVLFWLAVAGLLGWSAAAAHDTAQRPPRPGTPASEHRHEPLSFIDHTGRAVSEQDFAGRFRLVYFGYTHCPDVCPLDLQTLSGALRALGPAAEQVQPLFITVDPQRDTPRVLAGFVKFFHPRLVGLTGTRAQIAAAKRAYGVRAMKFFPLVLDEDDHRERSEADENSHYVFNHTASTYLVGPEGEIIERFERTTGAQAMAARIRERLGR